MGFARNVVNQFFDKVRGAELDSSQLTVKLSQFRFGFVVGGLLNNGTNGVQ
jgi:hypothetical protein